MAIRLNISKEEISEENMIAVSEKIDKMRAINVPLSKGVNVVRRFIKTILCHCHKIAFFKREKFPIQDKRSRHPFQCQPQNITSL